jgi:hypothetical protein
MAKALENECTCASGTGLGCPRHDPRFVDGREIHAYNTTAERPPWISREQADRWHGHGTANEDHEAIAVSSALDHAIRELTGAIDQVNTATGRLAHRLEPVLRPGETQALARQPDDDDQSPVVSLVGSLARHLVDTAHQVDGITARLDV